MNTTNKFTKKLCFTSLVVLVTFFTILLTSQKASAAQAPAKVTGLTQTGASSSRIDVKWNEVAGTDIVYDVVISKDGVNFTQDDLQRSYSNDCSIYEVTSGATYYVRVRAYEYSYGVEPVYSEWSDTLQVVTTPDTPKNLVQTTATTSTISLKWDAVAGATKYEIYQYVSYDKKVLKGTSRTNSYKVSKLKSGKEYNFYVVAVKTSPTFSAKSYNSNTLYYTKTLPGKLTGLKLDTYYSSIQSAYFKWNKIDNADKYEIIIYSLKNKKIYSTTTTSYSHYISNKVKNNSFYKVKARAMIKVNGKYLKGEWSSINYISGEPKNQKLANTKSGLKVSWSKMSGATSYTVYISTKQNSGYKKFKTVTGTSTTVTKYGTKKLKKNTTYYVYVVANRKVGKTTYKSTNIYCYYLKRR